eukprot:295001-Rhodomonas_salina.1
MTQRLIEPGMEAYLAPQDLSNVLWGLGSLGGRRVLLHVCYAVSGTDGAYAATPVTVERSVVNVLCERAVTLSAQVRAKLLRCSLSCYGVSSYCYAPSAHPVLYAPSLY